MNKYIFFIVLLGLLVGCGGGSGSSDSSGSQSTVTPVITDPVGSDEESAEPEQESESAPEVIGATQDLVVDSDFVLAASYEIQLDVEVQTDDRYLVVCSKFQESAGQYDVDYSDCSVRSALENGTYHSTLLLPNHVDELIAVLWEYDEAAEPEFQKWSRAISGDTFLVR